jgi:hypothetical protein
LLDFVSGNQALPRLAQHLFGAVAQHGLSAGAPVGDAPIGIFQNNRVR